MKPAFLLVLAFACIAHAQTNPTTQPSTPAPAAPLPPGMTRIFDGKSLDGWTQFPADSWEVRDSILASRGVGRGVICTNQSYADRYRIVFDIRHVSGNKDHRACVLVFCSAPKEGEKPLDALGGVQFQVPNGGSWDYRKGHNNGGKDEFTQLPHDKFDPHQWSRVELLVDADKGLARMAVAQPVGSKAVEVLQFHVPEAGKKGPIAWQMHNAGLFDEYKDVSIETNPKVDDLITTK